MPRRRALGLTRLLCALPSGPRVLTVVSMFIFLQPILLETEVVVVLRLRRMGGVTAQDLANFCESLDGGEHVHFLSADPTGDATATSSGLTRMIANVLPSGANAVI